MRQEVEEITVKNGKNNEDEFEVLNDNKSEVVSCSTYLTLLTSIDRDFLLSPSETQVKVSDLEGKVIGLYFSANWYPPCQKFNQVLIDAYEQLKSYDATLQDVVELIYRYGVRAFPFTKERLEELQEEEREKHESQTLINLLTNHDRDFLLAHPTPKQVTVASLMGKTIGLYFSAQWCLPGVNFTPKLISIYQMIKQMLLEKGDHEDFEIVFVSSDRDQMMFDSFFSTMPWLALPYGDPNLKDLTKHFDIQGIPSLVILGPDGKTVTKRGRNLINLYQGKCIPFYGG
ncbi:hypothetical protein F0562_027086 [Nyssa sinensis]|uniref:protein-disulfide reductase n=1 Tax=Nyssa sinensis TaxID=561372 RepID=A0A5J5B490_9ASTE|nr:hypothetical protein F0562_027086 [Nyssa sinensis]